MKTLRNLRTLLSKLVKCTTLFLITPLIRNLTKRVYLSYDSESVQDGVGAQVQRIIALAGLASYIRSNYQHSPIRDITTHPMDPFQESKQRFAFIERLNNHISPTDNCSIAPRNSVPIKVLSLKLSNLLLIILRSTLLRKNYLVVTAEVYSIVDTLPSIYSFHRNFLNINFIDHLNKSLDGAICVHFRRGVGGMALYHNQTIPRELPVSYYLKALKLEKSIAPIHKLNVLTDSPLIDTVYKVNADQIKLWENTPGYRDGALYIKGKDIRGDFQPLNLEIEVHVGGDPIVSLGILQNAKTLVMSKSSFSYVAALLNVDGKIYYPADFWHPRQKHWINIR
jgi:hypothetical protein